MKKQKVENFYILLHKLEFSFLKSTIHNHYFINLSTFCTSNFYQYCFLSSISSFAKLYQLVLLATYTWKRESGSEREWCTNQEESPNLDAKFQIVERKPVCQSTNCNPDEEIPQLEPKSFKSRACKQTYYERWGPSGSVFYWSKHENFGNQRVLWFPSPKTEKYAESVTVILPRNKQEPYYYSSSIYFFNKLPSQNS